MKYWKRVGVGTVFYTVLGSCVLAVKWNTHRGGDHGISVEEENTVRIDANSLKFNKLPENTDFDNSWTSLWELADNVMDHQTDMDEMDSRKELMDNIDQHRKMVDHTNNQQTVSSHHLRKREAKKPKNTKKRKKLNKKKTEQEKDESESKHKLSSKSATSESEESETAPESSDATSSDSSTSSSSSYEDLSSGDLHNHDDSDDEDDSDDDDDDDSGLTEEVSVTSEEDDSDDLESSAEVYSGPDSSPPASSDSTDESSASKAISGGSSEISYTMSSSAEDAFPVSESDEHKGKKKVSYTMSSDASVYSSSEDTSEEESKSKSKKDKRKRGKGKNEKREFSTTEAGRRVRMETRTRLPTPKITQTTSTTTEEYDSVYHNPGPAESSSEDVLTTPWPNFDDEDSAVHYIPSESKLWTTRENPDDSKPHIEDELYDMFNRFVGGASDRRSVYRFNTADMKSESADKSKLKSGGEPKITTKIRKKKNKKITEIDIKLDKKKEAKIAKTILAKGKGKLGIKEMEKSPNEKKEVKGKQIDEHGTMLKGDLEKEKVQLGGKKTKMKDETKLAGAINIKGEPGKQDGIKVESMLSTKGKVKVKHASVEHKMESFIAPGDSRIRADLPLKTSVKLETLKKPGMEMMKVKKAEVDPKKKAELEQELIKDYPVSGTVEITNWQGTFAPIAGEPYVAPLHHQPDSFWDAIYRSTDPDLPTPPGVVSLPEGEADPFTPTHPPATHHSENTHLANHAIGKNHLQEGMLMKNKDKGKKQEKKKPKLSPKEKKKKKKEKQQEKQGSRKVAGVGEKSDVHLQGNLPVHALAGKSKAGPHVQGFTKPNVMHAATKSEEHLKTPSEEERESGTTYKPEGAYEYPSFRHPDFNPDTAYDENGIPIHESPGWTPPPTLPGDHRFGKERSRAGAGLKDRAHGPIMKPNVAVNHKTETQHLSNNHLHPNIEHHKEVMQHMQQSLHPDTPNHQVLHNLQPPLHLNTANLRSPQTSQSLQAHIAAQEHEHLQESLHGLHMNHPAHDGKDHLHDPIHLADHHEPDNHHGVPLVLPAQHQGIAIKDGIANHKIQKRKADSTSAELKEDSSGVMSTKELTAAAEEYKKQVASKEFGVYRLTDQEKKNKEADAPMEALNPALYMHRNMVQVKKKPQSGDNPLEGIPDGAELIAVIVSPQEAAAGLPAAVRELDLHKMKKKQRRKLKKPIVYNKNNEALNPLLYKHRNMFKVSDIKDDGMKLNQEMMKKMAMQQLQTQQQEVKKAVPIEEYLKGPQMLKGRGRENYNPVFINPKKMFHVKTNKFKDLSEEHFIAKRENFKSKQQQDLLNGYKRDPLYNKKYEGMFAGKYSNAVNYPKEELEDPIMRMYIPDGLDPNPFIVGRHKVCRTQDGKQTGQRDKRETKKNGLMNAARERVDEHRKARLKQRLELDGGTPGAGRPKNLRRKTKDDEDSFASYFDGVDPNVVEEDESTSRPEITTMALIEIDPAEFMPRKYNRTYPRGIRHTPSTLPPEPKHYSWNKEFLSTEHLPFYVGNQVPDPGIKRPHLLQDSSVFYVDEDTNATQPNHSRATNRKQRKLAHRRKKLLQSNAAILHRLTREMRPIWRRELLDHNLNPDNTTMEFTESMQQEVAEMVELKLLEGTPNKDTIDQLTHQLHEIILTRQQHNKSVGHIVTGGEQQREPLVRGTVHISPDKTKGEYHLQYWPLDEISGSPRVLNGSLDLNELKTNLSHRNAASKILRSILTVRPRELAHHEADLVLNRIFTRPTVKLSTRNSTVGTMRETRTTKKVGKKLFSTSIPFTEQKMYVDLPQDVMNDLKELGIKNIETLKPMKRTTEKPSIQSSSKPVSLGVTVSPDDKLVSTGKIMESTSSVTDSLKSVFEIVTAYVTTESPMQEEFNKLRETITKSKNISSILWEEMVAREKNTEPSVEEIRKKSDKISSLGNRKLQQRIKDFWPGRGHPTMPPFVRRWPTFRSQWKIDLTPATMDDLPTPVMGRNVHLSTFLTMRPKYGGPRHEPFFFNDFSRIRTVYPTGVTTEMADTTEAVTEDSTTKHSFVTQSHTTEEFITSQSKTTQKHFPWPRFDWEKVDEKRRRFYKIGYEFKNDTPYDSFESSTIFEIPSYDWDHVVKKQSDYHRVGGKYRHLYTTERTTTWNYYEDDDSIFRGFDHNTTGQPYFVELKVSDKVHTVRPFYVRPTAPSPPTPMPTPRPTTQRTGLHKIKHHVSTGLKKFFSIFGFGKSKKKED
ncbi:uncharacterized protein LOC124354539 isoform X2 [Homalodisca vitripennis]|uniref:uncharacterized protein LOC124354539 isoform X2 n=1 Tax=Homalodisca vitripennis TaxID=197043 RepID=UPI001EECEA16|nr:uncharacterized protein LOC124354539 isoform X2 [Homalodisca vitripennis]